MLPHLGMLRIQETPRVLEADMEYKPKAL